MHRAHSASGSWRLALSLVASFATAAAIVAAPSVASAAPQAHILRIDPSTGVSNGSPELTTVIEIVQNNAMSDVLAPCNNLSGTAALDCQSTQMEKPGALWSAIKWPDGAAQLTVKVDGDDTPATFESQAQWSASKVAGSNIGTAWLISLDASSGMGSRYEEARQIANEFIAKMEPNDLMDVMVFDDRNTIQHSDWQTYANRAKLQAVLKAQAAPAPSHGNNRALFTQIKTMINDAFGTLGNTGGPTTIPLHQAMVLLSDGSGRGDAESASPSADVFHQFLDGGRFPADNTLLPKTPLPVVSLYFPGGSGVVNDAYKNNDQQFMQALANPEIGGFYDIVQGNLGSAEQKGQSIISIVKKRYDEMYVVKWRLSCLNLSPTQTFNLFFNNTKPLIAPDGSFKDVPIGVDPSQWPLDIDTAATQAEATKNPLYPGGTFKVFGNFCWNGDKTRAEAYYIPAGTKPDPNTSSTDPATALKAMQALQQQNMHGTATDASQTSVTFTIPDDDKVVDGTGDNAVTHLIVYDNKAKRSSGRDQKTILTLKAGKKPINWLLIAGIFGGVLVVGLIVITMLRSGGGGGGGGGGKKRRGGAPPPQPIVAGGGMPPQGGGYGGPQGGGYGGPPQGGGGYGPPQGGPGYGPQGGGGYGAAPQQNANAQMNNGAPVAPPAAPPVAAATGPVNVTCASCGSSQMAMPGRAGVCFTCGQPIAAAAGALGALASTARADAGVQPYEPPPSPYAGNARAATISGKNGHFTIHAGAEVRVGRDPAQCPVTLDDPRISGVHATLRFETPDLWARDETSNNGTWVQGSRIQPGTWVPVPNHSQLRFGPIEFDVQVEG